MANKSKKNKGRKVSVPVRMSYAKPSPNAQRGAVGGIYNRDPMQDYDKICSITNPFCKAAQGARLPDPSPTRSFPLTVREHFGYTTATGNMVVAIRARPNQPLLAATTTVTYPNATTGAGVSLTDNTVLSGSVGEYRIVSFGVRIYNSAAPTAQEGIIRLMTQYTDYSAATAYNYGSSLYEDTIVLPAAQKEIYWVAKPNGPEALNFRPWTSASDWNAILIVCENINTSAAINFEVVMHLECTPQLGTIPAALALPALDEKPHHMAARSQTLAKKAGVHSDKLMEVMGNGVKEAMIDIAGSAIPFIGGAAANVAKRLLRINTNQQRYIMVD